jgi:hypothetical protein
MDVEVAASLAGKEQRRAVAVFDPVKRVEGARLQRHRSHARLRLGVLELALGEGAAYVDDALLPIDVALLECDPFRRPQTRSPLLRVQRDTTVRRPYGNFQYTLMRSADDLEPIAITARVRRTAIGRCRLALRVVDGSRVADHHEASSNPTPPGLSKLSV